MEGNARSFKEIPLNMVVISGNNPRRNFDKLDDLVASIRTKGVLEPILVRPLCPEVDGPGELGRYEIVAGERRYRAASIVAMKNGGIEHYRIPAMVQEMSDDEAFDVMTIENLQREDLTELEEARGFKIYLDRKGIDALPTLAERTGIDARYIRRRLAVLGLPEAMLSGWEEGKIHYGHLEQLVRVQDPERQKSYYNSAVNHGVSVARFKTIITDDAPALKSALFSRADACETCHNNTSIQRKLFGADMANTGGQCLDKKCFKQRQEAWITENWTAYREKKSFPTNGFRFMEDVGYNNRELLHNHVKTKAKCFECSNFVTMLDLTGHTSYAGSDRTCAGDRRCFKELYEKKPTGEAAGDDKKQDKNAPRVDWHGRYFREAFYQAKLPLLEASLAGDDPRVMRIILLTLLEGASSESKIIDEFAHSYSVSTYIPKNSWNRGDAVHAWRVIEQFDAATLMRVLRETAMKVLLDGLNLTNNDYHRGATGPQVRHLVARHIGGDLQKDWQINQDYLEKKTIGEIKAIAKKFGIFKDEKARAFLYEKLGKKRDAFESCKKGELVRIFLESGVDLAGKVPAEILDVGKEGGIAQ